MKITIITPTFNSEKTITANVHSVINQTYKNFEHIIIDNESGDHTIEITEKIYIEAGICEKLKIISEKDSGISDAFNKGILASTGDVIAILNSDDEYFNSKIFEKVTEAFKDPGILFFHGDISFKDTLFGSNIRKPLLCPITTTMPYNHPTMFIRKEIYEKFGLYDTDFKYAMDYEFIIRLEKKLEAFREKGMYYSEQPVAIMNAGGASWNNELTSIEESKIALKKHGFWNYDAQKNYLLRIIRTYIKKTLNKLNLNGIVKYWRNKKWENS